MPSKHRTPRHRTYVSWYNMMHRCTNTSNAQYTDYGGRGIKVCERWGSFENFLADMGERPEGLLLERADNDSDYRPSNCRWATRAEQQRNRRNNIVVNVEGVSMCLKDAAAEVELPYLSLLRRIKRGMSFDEAVVDVFEYLYVLP